MQQSLSNFVIQTYRAPPRKRSEIATRPHCACRHLLTPLCLFPHLTESSLPVRTSSRSRDGPTHPPPSETSRRLQCRLEIPASAARRADGASVAAGSEATPGETQSRSGPREASVCSWVWEIRRRESTPTSSRILLLPYPRRRRTITLRTRAASDAIVSSHLVKMCEFIHG